VPEGNETRTKVLWGGAGFGFVLLAAAVVWLAWTVAGLRGRLPVEQEVETVAAEEEAAPPLPEPVATPAAVEAVSRPARSAAELAADPSVPAEPVQEPPGEDPEPPEPPMELAVPDTVELRNDPIPPPKRGVMATEKQFLQRLGKRFPGVAADKLDEQELEEFREVFCTKYRPEMAIGLILDGRKDLFEADPEIAKALTGAIYEKWMAVTPDADEEAFARADAQVMRRLESILPPGELEQLRRTVEDRDQCGFIPPEDIIQKHAWIFRSLKDQGFRQTLEESESILYGTMTPDPPKGISRDNPEYQKYVARARAAFENPDAKPPPGVTGSEGGTTAPPEGP